MPCRKDSHVNRVPTRTGKPGIPGKMREVFPVREKSGIFKILAESQGKVEEFWLSQGKVRENFSKNNKILIAK